jgi:hypothetical protein
MTPTATPALLLDEMFAPALATALRAQGHDVLSIAERVDMRAMTDPDVFAWVLAVPCWLLTENVKDFRPLLLQALQTGTATPEGFGLLFTSSRAFPRSRANPGPLIDALHVWLSAGLPAAPIVEDWLTAPASAVAT